MIQLDDLLNDDRLARLFTQAARSCALQLWILRVKTNELIENRLVYGRLLPYNFANDTWQSSDNDDFRSIGEVQIQLLRVDLFINSIHCKTLLRRLSSGHTISATSEELHIGLSKRLELRIGKIELTPDELTYRPVVYLLNRDAHDPDLPASPHGGAGAFSASIVQTTKEALFRTGGSYNVNLTKAVVDGLNSETGLDFGGADISRFGDIELLVFPTLDDREKDLLDVNWTADHLGLIVRLDPKQIPKFQGFQFRLSITNDRQVFHSSIVRAEKDVTGKFDGQFRLSAQISAIVDGVDLEIFGFCDDDFRDGTLCCRWRGAYIREIRIQTYLVGHRDSSVKFDWLEKTTRPSASARAKAALTVNRGTRGFTNHIGGRKADPWVTTNRDLVSLFAKLHPPNSEGRFFLRWGHGEGDGRLVFVEWFRELLSKQQQHQVVIFDPYFEQVGLGLLLLLGAPNVDFIVFASLSRRKVSSEIVIDESSKPISDRIENLAAECERNRNLLKRFKLRIFALKEGRLHDRYVLILGPDGLPTAGFSLSNSFQTVAENYPLLVTPIPPDILLKVEQYKAQLVREAGAVGSKRIDDNPSMRLVFDSATLPQVRQRHEVPRFLEKTSAGDVISAWAAEPSLRGLYGDPLRERLTELDLLRESSLYFRKSAGFSKFLAEARKTLSFNMIWELLGEALAYSNQDSEGFVELVHEREFLEFLAQFVSNSFRRVYEMGDEEIIIPDVQLFYEPLDTLLHSSRHPSQFANNTKFQVLTWPDYFAIELLWSFSPERLCAIAEAQKFVVPIESHDQAVVPSSLLGQILSVIALSVISGMSNPQQELLLKSSNGFLRWLGLSALEKKLGTADGFTYVMQKIASFSLTEKVRALGWMIQRSARNPKTSDIYNGLIMSLTRSLPNTISLEELRHLIDSMRGHMRHLGWAEPWLFQDIIFPLLRDKRAHFDHACEIWTLELMACLGPGYEHVSKLFERAHEGQTTNISAFLFSQSSVDRQRISLKFVSAILKRQRRYVQRPLASTSNWQQWDEGLIVSTWILAFARWCRFYLREQGGMISRELEQLELNANELATFRPVDTWQSTPQGPHSELTAFLAEVDGLLTS